jgi:hypothetical protein
MNVKTPTLILHSEIVFFPRENHGLTRTGEPKHLVPVHLPLTPGTRLGVYAITTAVGEGGMGQVFRARDTTRS